MAELKHRGHHVEIFGLGLDPSKVEYAWYTRRVALMPPESIP
jgi:hypothetical protein